MLRLTALRLSDFGPFKDQQKRSLFSQLLFPSQGQKTLDRHHGQVNAVAWSPESRIVIEADETIVGDRNRRCGQ